MGRWAVLSNNDPVVAPDSIQRLGQFLEQHPKAGMETGHLVYPDGSTQFMYYHVALPTLASISADLLWLNRDSTRNRVGHGPLARNWDPARPYQMEQIPGACLLVRREFFEQVGLFDETHGFWYEDVDLCARCSRAGWEMWYVPDAPIVDYGGGSTKLIGLSAGSLLRFRNMLRYAQRHFSRGHLLILKLVVGMVLLLRLPLVVGASLWPSARMKRRWR